MKVVVALLVLWMQLDARACPDAILGSDTSAARLDAVDYSEKGQTYRLTLDLTVIDEPESRVIQYQGQSIDAQVEHHTPLTLARWVKNVTMQAGGASKFVLGAVVDPRTDDVAVIPYSAVRSVSISQGDDFDANAAFQVRLELMLLHRLEPFEGRRAPFEPFTGIAQLGGHHLQLIPNESNGVFDPYGQSYGDYFADRDLVVSFVHGPTSPGEFTSASDPRPYKAAFAVPESMVHQPAPDAQIPKDGRAVAGHQVLDLYEYVVRIYSQVRPNVSVRDLVGRQVQLVVTGDRSWTPPESPYSHYRPATGYVHGRSAGVHGKPDGFVSTLFTRPKTDGDPWSVRPEWGAGRGTVVWVPVACVAAVLALALVVYAVRRRYRAARS